MKNVLNINNYIQDGFYKIADAKEELGTDKWSLINQHEDLYSEHRSWVYMIVDGDEIVKLGETGNPLGIKKKYDDQPIIGTQCRFGRLRGYGNPRMTDDTDVRIRTHLQESVEQGTVSLYAKKCEERIVTETIAGKTVEIKLQSHKDIEQQMLFYMEAHHRLPRLNAAKK